MVVVNLVPSIVSIFRKSFQLFSRTHTDLCISTISNFIKKFVWLVISYIHYYSYSKTLVSCKVQYIFILHDLVENGNDPLRKEEVDEMMEDCGSGDSFKYTGICGLILLFLIPERYLVLPYSAA